MIRLLLFKASDGKCPFQRWFDRLEKSTAKWVTLSLLQMRAGNFSDSRAVGGAVFERRIHTGPGYRIYYARDGDSAVVLLVGGSKKSQRSDIVKARRNWQEFKSRRLGSNNATHH